MAGVLGLGEVEWHSYHMNMTQHRFGPEIGKSLSEQPQEKPAEEFLEEEEKNIWSTDESQDAV